MPNKYGKLTYKDKQALFRKAEKAGIKNYKLEIAESTLEGGKRGIVAATVKGEGGYVGVSYDYGGRAEGNTAFESSRRKEAGTYKGPEIHGRSREVVISESSAGPEQGYVNVRERSGKRTSDNEQLSRFNRPIPETRTQRAVELRAGGSAYDTSGSGLPSGRYSRLYGGTLGRGKSVYVSEPHDPTYYARIDTQTTKKEPVTISSSMSFADTYGSKIARKEYHSPTSTPFEYKTGTVGDKQYMSMLITSSVQPSIRSFPQEPGRYNKLRYRPGVVGDTARFLVPVGQKAEYGWGGLNRTVGRLYGPSGQANFLQMPFIQRGYKEVETRLSPLVPVREVKEFGAGIGNEITRRFREQPVSTLGLMYGSGMITRGVVALGTYGTAGKIALSGFKLLGAGLAVGYAGEKLSQIERAPTQFKRGQIFGGVLVEGSAIALGANMGVTRANIYYNQQLTTNPKNALINIKVRPRGNIADISGTIKSQYRSLRLDQSFSESAVRISSRNVKSRGKNIFELRTTTNDVTNRFRGEEIVNARKGLTGGLYVGQSGRGIYDIKPINQGMGRYRYEMQTDYGRFVGTYRTDVNALKNPLVSGKRVDVITLRPVAPETGMQSLRNIFSQPIIGQSYSYRGGRRFPFSSGGMGKRGTVSVPFGDSTGTGGFGGTGVTTFNPASPITRISGVSRTGYGATPRFFGGVRVLPSAVAKPVYFGLPSYAPNARGFVQVGQLSQPLFTSQPKALYGTAGYRPRITAGNMARSLITSQPVVTTTPSSIASSSVRTVVLSQSRPLSGTGGRSPPPIIPPDIVPRWDIPPIFGIAFGGKGSGGGRRRYPTVGARRSYSYTPSLVSLSLGIRGRVRVPKGGFTGLEIRPIPI